MSNVSRAAGLGSIAALAAVLAFAGGPASATGTSSRGLCPNGKPPPQTISHVQALQLELLKGASFNSFDGRRVARDLRRNRRLWCGVILDRPESLIQLRDLGGGVWNADTLHVLSSGADDDKLRALAATWSPDDLGWFEGARADELLGLYGPRDDWRILYAWWE